MVLFSLLSPEVPGNWLSPYVTVDLPTQLPLLTAAYHQKPQPLLRLPKNQEVRPHNGEHGLLHTHTHTKYRSPRPTMDLCQEGND